VLGRFPVEGLIHLVEDNERRSKREMSVGGRSMLQVTGRFASYFDPTGLAAARTDEY
jgi:hypothetical protein